MTIETKINIGDPALIYVGDSLKLGVCNCIHYNGVSILYQFDVGNTYVNVKVDETHIDNRVFYTLYDGVQFMKEMKMLHL